MNSFSINDAVLQEVFLETGFEALGIVSQRLVDDAKPLTRVLRVKPPGRGSSPYPAYPGELRASIHFEVEQGTEGPVSYIYARGDLGAYRDIAGTGQP